MSSESSLLLPSSSGNNNNNNNCPQCSNRRGVVVVDECSNSSSSSRSSGSSSWMAMALSPTPLLVVVILILVAIILSPSTTTIHKNNNAFMESHYHNINNDASHHAWQASIYQKGLLELEGLSPHKFDDDDYGLIYLNHTAGFEPLRSGDKSLTSDFYYYQQGWDAQINQAYCAIATTAAMMNSLRGHIELPQDPTYDPYPWATQVELVDNDCVRTTVYDKEAMQGHFFGLGIQMAETLMNCHLVPQGYQAFAHPVDPSKTSVDELRTILLEAIQDPQARVAINYDRGGVGQSEMGHGHFSPLGAYDEATDSFLILDVAKYKFPPVWAPTKTVLRAIATVDFCSLFTYPHHPIDPALSDPQRTELLGCQSSFRGYVIVKSISPPLLL